MRRIVLLIIYLISWINLHASYKVYLIHGYGGTGAELNKIQNEIKKNGYLLENFKYQSFSQDVDSVGKFLYHKIKQDGYDTISFVTHSMGALIVRALFENIKRDTNFPIIHRIVMIAPPNKGSPVADYYKQFEIIRFLAGPNINNLTTDSITGSNKYPIPSGEIGLIIGNINKKKCYTVPLEGENDGVVLVESAKMGIEKDVCYVKATHISLLFNKRVKVYVISFLKNGNFE